MSRGVHATLTFSLLDQARSCDDERLKALLTVDLLADIAVLVVTSGENRYSTRTGRDPAHIFPTLPTGELRGTRITRRRVAIQRRKAAR